MTDDERRRAAQAVLAIPFFNDLMDDLQQAAVNACINAPINDDETRRNQAAEARAIIRLRQRIGSLAEEKAERSRKAPA